LPIITSVDLTTANAPSPTDHAIRGRARDDRCQLLITDSQHHFRHQSSTRMREISPCRRLRAPASKVWDAQAAR
jgi:hypothetical protein